MVLNFEVATIHILPFRLEVEVDLKKISKIYIVKFITKDPKIQLDHERNGSGRNVLAKHIIKWSQKDRIKKLGLMENVSSNNIILDEIYNSNPFKADTCRGCLYFLF